MATRLSDGESMLSGRENAGAADVDLGEINDAAATIPVHGERYPTHLQRLTNR